MNIILGWDVKTKEKSDDSKNDKDTSNRSRDDMDISSERAPQKSSPDGASGAQEGTYVHTEFKVTMSVAD